MRGVLRGRWTRRGERAQDDPELRRTGRLLTLEASLATPLRVVTLGAATAGLALALGATPLQISLLTALPQFAALMQLGAGSLGGRFGSRKRGGIALLTLGRAVALLMVPLPLLAYLFPGSRDALVWGVILGLTLTVGGTALGTVLWLGWVTDLVPPTRRGGFFAQRSLVAGVLAMALGPAIGLWLDADRAAPGAPPDLWRFAALFAVVTLVAMTASGVLARVPEAQSPPMQGRNLRAAVRATWENPPMRTLLIHKIAFGFAIGFGAPFFQVYLIRDLALPYTLIYLTGTLNALVALVSYRVWGRVLDRRGARPVLAIAVASKGLMSLAYVLLTPATVWPFLIIINLFGYADAGLELGTTNLLMKLAPRERNTEQFAVVLAFAGAATALSPLLAAPLVIWLADTDLALGGLHIGALQMMFLLSGVLRIASLAFMRGLREPDAAPAARPALSQG